MKTKLIIEIETPDEIEVYPEEGQTAEDFKGKEKELQDFREQYVKDLHKAVVDGAKKYFDDGTFEENFLDSEEEIAIEGHESFDDYGIKIKTDVKEG